MQRPTSASAPGQRDRRSASSSALARMLCLSAAGVLLASPEARAQAIKNPIAVFNGLDKITGRIVSFEVGIGETVQFGSLQLTPRACHTRPPTETPNTTAFLEVDEVGAEGRAARLFTGWVFAASPGLHGIEHPVYDIWLTDCARAGTPAQAQGSSPDAGGDPPPDSGGMPDPDAPPLPPRRPAFPQTSPAQTLQPQEPLPQDPLFSPGGY